MKTESDKPTEIIVPLGQALKDARLAASLTIDEVAKQLNFAPSTIKDFEDNLDQVLETNKYPVIYLRGYLANYAKLVGLNTLELFVEYQQLASVQKKPKKMVTSELIIPQVQKRSKKGPFFLLMMIAIGVIIFLYHKQLLATFEDTASMFQSSSETNSQGKQNRNVLIAKGQLSSAAATHEEEIVIESKTQVEAEH